MWVPVPSICDRKLPVCLWVLQGWLVRQLDRQRGSKSDSYLPLGWLVPPKCWMVLACLRGSESAWEAPWVSASLVAAKQRALTSQMVQVQVTLVSLIVAEWRASASRVAWAQMALASLMDSIVSESFRWSSMSNSQTTFCLPVLMDDLVASSSSRTLLALSQRWHVSVGWVLPLGPGVSAMEEMVVGTSSREASTISASSGALTWDDVSTGLERDLSLWGGGASMTTGLGLLGVKFPDTWPDVSNIAWDRRLLTSMVMLTSLSSFGGVVLRGLAIRMGEHLPRGNTFWSSSSTMGCRMSTSK